MKELNVGDKIVIKKGMQIKAFIPEKFINSDKPFSSKKCLEFITVGKVYERRNVSKQEVLEEFKNRMDDFFFLTDYEIEKIIDAHPTIFSANKYYTDYYAGTYTITGITATLSDSIIVHASRTNSFETTKIVFYTRSDYCPIISDIEVIS